jgi:hypothetical protein
VTDELFDVYHSKIIVVSYSKLIVPHPKPHPIPGAKQMLETGPSDDQILKFWMVPSHPYQVNNQTHACCIVGPMELQTDLDVAFPEGGRGIYRLSSCFSLLGYLACSPPTTSIRSCLAPSLVPCSRCNAPPKPCTYRVRLATTDGRRKTTASITGEPSMPTIPALMCTRLDDNINSIVLSLI